MIELATNHLDLNDSDFIYIRFLPDACLLIDPIECGTVASYWWPWFLGEKPAWFDDEVQQCVDWFDEIRRRDDANAREIMA